MAVEIEPDPEIEQVPARFPDPERETLRGEIQRLFLARVGGPGFQAVDEVVELERREIRAVAVPPPLGRVDGHLEDEPVVVEVLADRLEQLVAVDLELELGLALRTSELGHPLPT